MERKYFEDKQIIKSAHFMYFMILVFGLWLNSCGDKCKDVYCENGYCIKGDCFCDQGFSGSNCEVKESDKFVGLYSGKLSFPDMSVVQSVDVKVKNDQFNPFDINIGINSHNGVGSFELKAHVRDDSIFIEQTFNEFYTDYDTTINLIYTSVGKLVHDSIIEIPIIYKNIEHSKIYSVQLLASK